jgi:hypothetical protein
MTNAPRKTLLLFPVIVACLICSAVSGQEKQFVCRDHKSLWRDANGKPIRLSSDELKKRRTHCEPAKTAGDLVQ